MHRHALSVQFRAGLRRLLSCACAFCGAVRGDPVYNGCTGDLASRLHRRRCIQCAIILNARHAARYYRTRLAGAPDFDVTVVIVDYTWSPNHLVTGLEFRAQLPLADWLAAQLDNALAAAPGDLPDMLLPIPLLPAHLRSRDYSQAWEAARRAARRLDIPAHIGTLQRVHDNVAQAALDRAKRLTNPHDAFVVTEPARVAGRHIEVVNDVTTTGTTLGEIATQLKRAGATRIINVVALRTP